jgi:aspartate/methionine/tyrosine aminotransferase
MKFPRFRYMAWAKEIDRRPGIHLTRSGVDLPLPAELDLPAKPPRLKPQAPYGSPELKEALARRYGWRADGVFLSPGSSSGNYIVCAVLLGPGDEAVVEHPTYEVLAHLPILFGATVRRWHRTFEEDWQVDLASLARLLSPRTRLVILSNPHNPSGRALSQDRLERLAALCGERGVPVLVDEVYLDLAPENLRRSAVTYAGRMMATNSLTKSFGLGGLRMGWTLAGPETVGELDAFQDLLSVINAEPSVDLATRALGRAEAWAEAHRRRVAENAALVEAWMETQPRLAWKRPDVGFGFPRIMDGPGAADLARVLEKEYRTYIVPGGFFDGFADHFRLGFAADEGLLKKGLDNVSEALRRL